MTDNELYALMYQDETEATPSVPGNPEEKPIRAHGIMNMPQMSAEIRRLQKLVDEQDRIIRKMDTRIRQIARHMNQIGNSVNDLGHDLDGKMDRF